MGIVFHPSDLPDDPLDDEAFLWELYHDRDWDQRTIAYELDETPEAVLRALLEHEIMTPWRSERRLREAIEAGKHADEIASEWDVGRATLAEWAERHDLDEELFEAGWRDRSDDGWVFDR